MERLKNIVREKLRLSAEENPKISYLGGMTNKNYLVETSQDKYVLRIPGAMTDSLINRHNESINSVLVANIGINVETLHFDNRSGIKLTKFLEDSETLCHQSIKKKIHLSNIAKKLRSLHLSTIKFENEFNIFVEFERYFNLLKNKNVLYKSHSNINELISLFYSFKNILNQPNLLVPCHNDLVPENILVKGNSYYFIDWEYSGMNNLIFDLAAFCLEAILSEEEQRFFIKEYFKNESLDHTALFQQLLAFQMGQDLLWFVWTLVKEENNEFFGDYAKKRIDRAIKTMNTIVSQSVS
ncbi:hypothetical protein B0188_04155, partial [[Haemophilus] felis]